MSSNNFVFSIILAVLLIICGFAIIFNPTSTMVAFTVIISIVMILSGIVNIFIFLNMKSYGNAMYYLIDGALSLIAGVLLISSRTALENFIPLLIGFWIALKSVTILLLSFDMKKNQSATWKVFLAGGIAGILLAFLIAAFPKIISIYLSIILGIMIIGAAVIILIYAYYLRKIRY